MPEGVFGEGVLGPEMAAVLQRRVHQHNIRVLAKYYSQISFQRLSELLHISCEEAETELRDMVSYQGLKLKMDRPAGRVDFLRGGGVSQELDAWRSDIGKLLTAVEEAAYLAEN